MTQACGHGVEFCFSDILIFKCPSLHGLWCVRTNGILLSAYYVLALCRMLLYALLDLLLPTTLEVSARIAPLVRMQKLRLRKFTSFASSERGWSQNLEQVD